MITADMTGKSALVTGGASGIGLSCAKMLANCGATVAINYLPSDEAAADVVQQLIDDGLRIVPAPGDVSIPGKAETMVREAISRMGRLDYLVNNAATPGVKEPVHPSELDKMTEELWRTVLSTNLLGPFRCSHAASEELKRRRGAIVNVSSIAGLGKQGSSIAYAASKTALVSLTKSLARGLGPEVRVNAVAPGQTITPWTEAWSEERKEMAKNLSVLNCRIEPDDVAEAILFLCSGARAITGHVLVVDAGMTL